MSKKMLIDAAHPEEVRVALLSQNRIEDFDFESASKKPLRGNIFLARVTRVEPSLQAAFVDYGGNRHGFLAFSEIHPDYYQIPVSDRKALQEAEQEVAELAAKLELVQRGDEDDDDDIADRDDQRASADIDDDDPQADDGPDADADDENGDDPRAHIEEEEEEENVRDEDKDVENDDDDDVSEDDEPEQDDASALTAKTEDDDTDLDDEKAESELAADEEGAHDEDDEDDDNDAANDEDGDHGSQKESRNALFERYKDAKRKRANLLRNYKIQEVIKRRQILLIQVVKEERGTKGAALTTYMSLAGRYCVLMPNTARGGGISRKIANGSDRRRLRRVVDSLDVPQGMGLIIRTAGAKRTKTEIKRDYDYLLRLWENIRSLTLKSIAPCLIYEEASLIKRAIRDLYDKDISMVYVEGEEGYREAKDFMKMLMPSHAKNVQPYKDRAPIFLKHNVEAQLDGMYQPSVRLKSGGYLVIHQTEALVAIDVNSGRATRERNIEQTALKTNIEAAEEAARQFRLRDLAGLIVIDFIDMEEMRNNRKVEKALKDAMKADRARLQVGRISQFGLLELSRQRRRSGIVDGTTQACPTCSGAGVIRSDEIAALRILRAVEGDAIFGKVGMLRVQTSTTVALHVLNHNRDWINRIEANNGVTIEIVADAQKHGDEYSIEKSGAPRTPANDHQFIRADQTDPVETEDDDQASSEEKTADAEGDEERAPRKRRRRRRGRKDRQDQDQDQQNSSSDDNDEENSDDDDVSSEKKDARDDGDQEERPKKRRRRGRRGGRRNRKDSDSEKEAKAESDDDSADEKNEESGPTAETNAAPDASQANDDGNEQQVEPDEEPQPVIEETPSSESAPVNGATQGNGSPDLSDDAGPTAIQESQPEETAEDAPPPKKKRSRKGWWQRSTD